MKNLTLHKLFVIMPAILFVVVIIMGSCAISTIYLYELHTPKWIAFAFGTLFLTIWTCLTSLVLKAKILTNCNELLWCSFSLLSIGYLYYRSYGFYDLYIYVTFLLFCFVVSIYNRKLPLLVIAAGSFVICSIAYSILAIKQYFMNEDLVGCSDSVVGLALTIVIGSVSLIFLLKQSFCENPIIKVGGYLLLGLFVFVIIVSKSRVSLFALAVVCLFLFKKKGITCLLTAIIFVASLTFFNTSKPSRLMGGYLY